MKTESRKEVLDRLNELEKDNQRTVFPFKPLSMVIELANAQEGIIEKMKWKCEQIAYNAFGQSALNIKHAEEAIALADAPYGGER